MGQISLLSRGLLPHPFVGAIHFCMLIKLRNKFYQVECALSSIWQQICLTFDLKFVVLIPPDAEKPVNSVTWKSEFQRLVMKRG